MVFFEVLLEGVPDLLDALIKRGVFFGSLFAFLSIKFYTFLG